MSLNFLLYLPEFYFTKVFYSFRVKKRKSEFYIRDIKTLKCLKQLNTERHKLKKSHFAILLTSYFKNKGKNQNSKT